MAKCTAALHNFKHFLPASERFSDQILSKHRGTYFFPTFSRSRSHFDLPFSSRFFCTVVTLAPNGSPTAESRARCFQFDWRRNSGGVWRIESSLTID